MRSVFLIVRDDPHLRAVLERGLRFGDQPAVEDVVDLVILRLALVDGDALRRGRLVEQLGEVEALGLPVLDHLALVEHLHLPDHLGEGAVAHRRHDLAHFFGDEEEEIDDVLGLCRRISCAAPGPASRRRPGRC